jgi:predicted transposase YdaD
LTAVSVSDLPGVVQRGKERIRQQPKSRAVKLHSATSILMGLRFPDKQIQQLLGGVEMLKESTVYQRIFREGRREGRITEAHRFLIRLATKRFGKADAATVAALKAIQDSDRLEALGERLVEGEFHNWDDLLRGS